MVAPLIGLHLTPIMRASKRLTCAVDREEEASTDADSVKSVVNGQFVRVWHGGEAIDVSLVGEVLCPVSEVGVRDQVMERQVGMAGLVVGF